MQETNIRLGQKKFIDNKNFPRGFSKSGEFTISDSYILTQYGVTLSGLESGELSPENQEEQRLLDVISGQFEAQSKIEKVWMKYLLLTRKRKNFHTLHSSVKNKTERHEYHSSVDDSLE